MGRFLYPELLTKFLGSHLQKPDFATFSTSLHFFFKNTCHICRPTRLRTRHPSNNPHPHPQVEFRDSTSDFHRVQLNSEGCSAQKCSNRVLPLDSWGQRLWKVNLPARVLTLSHTWSTSRWKQVATSYLQHSPMCSTQP